MNVLPSHDSAALHATGRSRFIDDLPLPPGALHAAVLPSPMAHGRLTTLDTAPALAVPGVVAVLTAADIPGDNQIGVVIADEPLLAADEVHYCGQPLALVLADSADHAHSGIAALRPVITELPACFDSREAATRGDLFAPPRQSGCGDPDTVWERCTHVIAGQVACGGQEQLYMETQASLAIPRDDGSLLIHTGTQSPSATQATVARVLGLAQHRVEVDVQRLGGGFGGKESQASPWAALAALGATHSGHPIKLVLRRHEDLVMTGKRHPYQADFRLGLAADGRILAYQVDLFQNAGAYTDLSLAVLDRSLFHVGGSYRIDHLRATGWSCRTNLPPFTAMRGFGGPQGTFVVEAAIQRAAQQTGLPAEQIQQRSLLAEGDPFPYGQRALRCHARSCKRQAEDRYQLTQWRQGIADFNAKHLLQKKGLAQLPLSFGISFTYRPLNQGSALVHIYLDGSIGFSTGAVEMGQGVTDKLRRVVAQALGVDLERVRAETSNTTRVANVSASAASFTADLNGKALLNACADLRRHLLGVAAQRLGSERLELDLADERVRHQHKDTGLAWPELIQAAYEQRTSLSAQAHYKTPGLDVDTDADHDSAQTQIQRHPFAYHVYGHAITEVTLDCLRGTYRIDRVAIVHDIGQSLTPAIDRGQIEGALVQGIGWLTSEELVYDAHGRLLSDSLANYKIPDIHAAPLIDIEFLDDAAEPAGLLQSKAVGEPPFLYGIGAYLALLQAIAAFRTQEPVIALDAPLTPERVLMALYGKDPGP